MGNATSSAAALADLRVVILGASFAGLAAAHAAHTAGFSVTVVEPRDRFFHVIGAPRCVVEDGFETAVHIGYDRTLPASARLTRVRGYAQSVNTASKTVTLTMLDSSDAAGGNRAKNLGSGAGGPVTLSYDLLVIATGTAAWHKSGPALTSSVAAMQADAALRAAVLAARQVVVVGGGAVGIETAGEIKTDHPDKVVTLIHSGAHLMSSDAAGKLPASFYGLLLKGLAAKGVTVRLGERAAGHGADGPEAATAAGLTVVRQGVYAGRDTLKSAGSGNHLVTCDLQLWMTGSGAPNTAWCKTDATLAAACTPAGFLRVTPTWQVEGCVDVFALGDVTTGSGDGKFAWIVRSQAPEAVANMVTLARAALTSRGAGSTAPLVFGPPSTPLKPHVPITPLGTTVTVTLGRSAGVAFLFGVVCGDAVMWLVKARDMFVLKTNWELGYGVGETRAANAAALAGAVLAEK